jgi:hypothetical protein
MPTEASLAEFFCAVAPDASIGQEELRWFCSRSMSAS